MSANESAESALLWLHEIKHDGFRVIARKDGQRVKLYSRPGNDLTDRFSLIVGPALSTAGGGIVTTVASRPLIGFGIAGMTTVCSCTP